MCSSLRFLFFSPFVLISSHTCTQLTIVGAPSTRFWGCRPLRAQPGPPPTPHATTNYTGKIKHIKEKSQDRMIWKKHSRTKETHYFSSFASSPLPAFRRPPSILSHLMWHMWHSSRSSVSRNMPKRWGTRKPLNWRESPLASSSCDNKRHSGSNAALSTSTTPLRWGLTSKLKPFFRFLFQFWFFGVVFFLFWVDCTRDGFGLRL